MRSRVTGFTARPRLLNVTLSVHDAETAARYVVGGARPEVATEELHAYISDVWDSPYVASFLGGRASLYAIVEVLGLRPGDEVLVPAFTCQAVANAFSFHGVELVFVDIELGSFGMNAEAARRAVTARTKAILLQHTFGLVARDAEALCAMAKELGLYVIEDCAHATGGRYRNALLGTLGDIAFFSSERSKVVNTIHGGWVITRNKRLGRRLEAVYRKTREPSESLVGDLLKTLCHEWSSYNRRNSARVSRDLRRVLDMPYSAVPQMYPKELGGMFVAQYGLRMPNIIAKLLLQQLRRLPEILARRRSGASYWEQWASAIGVQHASPVKGSSPSWLRFPIFVPAGLKRSPGKLSQILGCDVGVWFTTPIHPQPFALPGCPLGTRACATCVNLPTWLPRPR